MQIEKGKIFNISIETDTVCNVLPIPVDINGPVIVKLKLHLRYWGYVYFEPCVQQEYNKLSTISKEKTSFMKISPLPIV